MTDHQEILGPRLTKGEARPLETQAKRHYRAAGRNLARFAADLRRLQDGEAHLTRWHPCAAPTPHAACPPQTAAAPPPAPPSRTSTRDVSIGNLIQHHHSFTARRNPVGTSKPQGGGRARHDSGRTRANSYGRDSVHEDAYRCDQNATTSPVQRAESTCNPIRTLGRVLIAKPGVCRSFQAISGTPAKRTTGVEPATFGLGTLAGVLGQVG
jgi:hypothetical protein